MSKWNWTPPGAVKNKDWPWVKDPKGHVWKMADDYDDIDVFGLDFEYHNGPRCIRCGYSFCYHCSKEVPEPCTFGTLT